MKTVEATAACDVGCYLWRALPDRISRVLANAPFDVMQVSRVSAPLRHVGFKRGGGAVAAAGNVRAAFVLPGKPSF